MSGKLTAWLALVGIQIVVNYAGRASETKPDRNAVYHYGFGIAGIVVYAIILGIVLAIAASGGDSPEGTREQVRDLLALRRPRSWARALGGALAVALGVIALELALDPLLHPGREQGLTPTRWEPAHAGAFAVSVIAIAVVGPIVEEATFRGLGYSLLSPYGQAAAVILVGLLFGLAHGLVQALPVLVVLGAGLALIRARTDSLYPCIAVHAAFNAIALASAVTS